MILIISNEKDQSTCKVIDWLYYLKEDFFVITDKDDIELIELDPAGNLH